MKIIFSFFALFFSLYCFCQYDAIKPQGVYNSGFIIDEKPRNITYYMPAAYGKQEAYPLLVVLYPEKSDAASIIKKYGSIIHAKADSAGCIVLYPEAYKGHWNSTQKDSVNDVGFINIMVEFFLRQFDCDVSKMRMLGFGSGGSLCYKFSCESIYKPVTIATLNAATNESVYPNCRNSKEMPVLPIKTSVITKTDINEALHFLFRDNPSE